MPYDILMAVKMPFAVGGIKEGIIEHLENALATWNKYLSEIWQLLTTSPTQFRGDGSTPTSAIWRIIVHVHSGLQGIGIGLLVLFFVFGIIHTCSSFTELKRPEVGVKLFVRFALAKLAITNGMEFMMNIINFVQGVINQKLSSDLEFALRYVGLTGAPTRTRLPTEVVDAIISMTFSDFFDEIGMWLITLIGGLFVTVLSFIMLMTVYGRFFKLYMYIAVSPMMLSTFAAESTQNVGKGFAKNFIAVCLEGVIIVVACIIFTVYSASSPFTFDPSASASTIVWEYILELILNLLVLVGSVKMCDRIVKEMMGQ